jgi:hypothetical protein
MLLRLHGGLAWVTALVYHAKLVLTMVLVMTQLSLQCAASLAISLAPTVGARITMLWFCLFMALLAEME